MGVHHEYFEEALVKIKKKYKAAQDTDLTAEQMEELVEQYKAIYKKHVGSPFPQDPMKQLELSIKAVFNSWQTERAVKYRVLNKITGLIGTAVNVQTMVFGNMGDDCATGVAFTRDGSTGEAKPMGEYLINAQGEDVVAGIRTPQNLDDIANEEDKGLVKAGAQLLKTMAKLEKHYKYPQDVEFTIEQGKLYMLQTRNAKRVGIAGVRWAVEMATGVDVISGEKLPKLLTDKQALQTVTGSDLEQLLFPIFNAKEEATKTPVVTGLPAGPGAAVGAIVLNSDKAEAMKKKDPNVKLILVRHETSPEDVGGMGAAQGILTSTGGMTSHAAVVARGWGKCCICGAGELKIDYKKGTVTVGKKVFKEGDTLSLNGSTGRVYEGEISSGSSPVVAALVDNDKAAKKHWIYKCIRPSLIGRTSIARSTFAPTRILLKTRRTRLRLVLKASACVAPSTCSSKAIASLMFVASSLPKTKRIATKRLRSFCLTSEKTLKASSKPWPESLSPFVCSIHHFTSSCLTPKQT